MAAGDRGPEALSIDVTAKVWTMGCTHKLTKIVYRSHGQAQDLVG